MTTILTTTSGLWRISFYFFGRRQFLQDGLRHKCEIKRSNHEIASHRADPGKRPPPLVKIDWFSIYQILPITKLVPAAQQRLCILRSGSSVRTRVAIWSPLLKTAGYHRSVLRYSRQKVSLLQYTLLTRLLRDVCWSRCSLRRWSSKKTRHGRSGGVEDSWKRYHFRNGWRFTWDEDFRHHDSDEILGVDTVWVAEDPSDILTDKDADFLISGDELDITDALEVMLVKLASDNILSNQFKESCVKRSRRILDEYLRWRVLVDFDWARQETSVDVVTGNEIFVNVSNR